MAATIRQDVIEMVSAAGSGHIAGPLGMADVFAALYFHILRHDPKNPEWPERDRLVLSNGHIVPVRYAAMARSGYFPVSELSTLRKFGTRLQGHPHRASLPGVETTSGPLGSGLSQAVGMAIAARMDKKKINVYCLMSDGEQECGQTWEAAMLAGKLKLDNLTALIDRNNIQIDGMTEDIMPLEPIRVVDVGACRVMRADGVAHPLFVPGRLIHAVVMAAAVGDGHLVKLRMKQHCRSRVLAAGGGSINAHALRIHV